MKSKNKFTNNFNLLSRIKNESTNSKSTTYISAAIIALILGFSIYILYFNNQNSEDYLVENFDVGKYVDVCKNRNTHFYNLLETLSTAFIFKFSAKTVSRNSPILFKSSSVKFSAQTKPTSFCRISRRSFFA